LTTPVPTSAPSLGSNRSHGLFSNGPFRSANPLL
jgi:hypothetical protein